LISVEQVAAEQNTMELRKVKVLDEFSSTILRSRTEPMDCFEMR
jgi:hypothetical protein